MPIGMQYRKTTYAANEFDTYWFEKNLQGDVVQLRSIWGALLAEYDYDAWGNCTVVYQHPSYGDLANINPIRYRGYVYDFETGFYYLQSRYYDPQVRRFISIDAYVSTGQNFIGFNMYVYCLNNPTGRIEIGGYFSVTALEESLDIVHFNHLDAMGYGAGGTGILSPIGSGSESKVGGKAIAALLLTATTTISAQKAKEAEINSKHPNTYTVYFLADETGCIRYVGRTKNLSQRLAQHKNPNSRTSMYELAFAIPNLKYTQARGVEEIGIVFYGTLNTAGNLIRGISEKNLNKDIYIESALDIIYNRELNIILNAEEGFQ